MAVSILSLQSWGCLWNTVSECLWHPNTTGPHWSKYGNLLTQPGFITGHFDLSSGISSDFISFCVQIIALKLMPLEVLCIWEGSSFRSNLGSHVGLGLLPVPKPGCLACRAWAVFCASSKQCLWPKGTVFSPACFMDYRHSSNSVFAGGSQSSFHWLLSPRVSLSRSNCICLKKK